MAAFNLSLLYEELTLVSHCILLCLSVCFPHLSVFFWIDNLKVFLLLGIMTGISSSCRHARQTSAILTRQRVKLGIRFILLPEVNKVTSRLLQLLGHPLILCPDCAFYQH